jgi:hypothetical protein
MTECCGWEADTSCCPGWNKYPADVQNAAVETATEVLYSLTGRILGACPKTVRPCRIPCPCNPCDRCGNTYTGPMWIPSLIRGQWFNLSCAHPDPCSCGPNVQKLNLPGPVHRVDRVIVDGIELPKTAWAVWNKTQLIRRDGEHFPACQDLTRDITEPGTWAVQYTRGIPLSAAGRRSVGILACELAKLCAGDKCRIPPHVTSVLRDGVTWNFDPTGFYQQGLTGIPEVDMWVNAINPDGLRRPSAVWSPDLEPAPQVRSTPFDVWPA